jgi:predicted ATPase
MPNVTDIVDALGGIGYNAMYLPNLVKRCQTGGIVPFVGAGMSRPTFPLWNDFLLGTTQNPALKAEINARLGAFQYEEAASLIRARLGWRLFEDLLQSAFGDERLPSGTIGGAVKRLAEFPPGPIVTTNFDRVIETVFAQAGKPLAPVWHDQAVAGSEALQHNEAFLLKLHGDWKHMNTRVLTREEYETAYGDADLNQIDHHRPIPQLLNILLPSRSCLFLGCSLKQDRTMRLLRTIAGIYQTTHFAAVEKPSDPLEFETRTRELSELGICPIWYPTGEHAWLDPLLEYLAGKSHVISQPAPISNAFRREPPNNIPRPPNPTVGRGEEIHQIIAMLGGASLVVILGAGGCGKSRVAMDVAYEIRHEFPEGVWFVDLANLSEKADKENLLPARIGSIAGVPQQPARPPLEALVERFASGKHLVVLDNCEHLISSCSALLIELLARCPGLQVLATSRKPLEVSQQRPYPLSTLLVPPSDASKDMLLKNESIQLFVARAGKKFEVTDANASAVAELCRALDGLPLAIELAAARLGVRSVQQMNKESRALLASLEGGKIDDLRHWNTLNAALEWSYKLLPKVLRDFLRPLAVFDGGWTEEWATAMHTVKLGKSGVAANMLQKLLDNSVVVSREVNGVVRFRFLEPIRQFVLEKLTAAEALEYRGRHAAIFATLSEEASPQLLKGDQAKWLSVLQEEVDNLRAAFRFAMETGDTETALRVVGSVWRFLEIRGYYTEGRQRSTEAIAMAGAEKHPALLQKALSGAGWLAFRQADFVQAESLIAKALEIAEKLEDAPGTANALNDLGSIARVHGQYSAASERLTRCLDMERRLGDRRMVGVALHNLGCVALDQGDLDDASRKLAESLDEFREQSNRREIAFPLRALAEVALFRSEPGLARDYGRESLEIRVELKDSKGRAETLCTLAWVEIEAGDPAGAMEMLTESLGLAKAIGDRRTISEALEVAALAYSRLEKAEIATQLLGGASRVRQRIGFAMPPVRKKHIDAVIADGKSRLGEVEFQGLWQRGESHEADTLIELAARPVHR